MIKIPSKEVKINDVILVELDGGKNLIAGRVLSKKVIKDTDFSPPLVDITIITPQAREFVISCESTTLVELLEASTLEGAILQSWGEAGTGRLDKVATDEYIRIARKYFQTDEKDLLPAVILSRDNLKITQEEKTLIGDLATLAQMFNKPNQVIWDCLKVFGYDVKKLDTEDDKKEKKKNDKNI